MPTLGQPPNAGCMDSDFINLWLDKYRRILDPIRFSGNIYSDKGALKVHKNIALLASNLRNGR